MKPAKRQRRRSNVPWRITVCQTLCSVLYLTQPCEFVISKSTQTKRPWSFSDCARLQVSVRVEAGYPKIWTNKLATGPRNSLFTPSNKNMHYTNLTINLESLNCSYAFSYQFVQNCPNINYLSVHTDQNSTQESNPRQQLKSSANADTGRMQQVLCTWAWLLLTGG